MNSVNSKKVHVIGIGGVGMSGVAKLLKDLGWSVSGSDDGCFPPTSTLLEQYGISFHHSYTEANIPSDASLIIIGKNARLTPEENKEVRAAFESGIPIRSFPEVLSGLTEETENIIVAGSYGKSTCTALMAWILRESGKDPSYFLGAVPAGDMLPVHLGESDHFILEGDEYPSSHWDPSSKFLHYHPHDLLLTSLEHDHFNVFPTHEEYCLPYRELLHSLPADGLVVTSGVEEETVRYTKERGGPFTTYAVEKHDGVVWYAKDVSFTENGTEFTLMKDTGSVTRMKTPLLGLHNVENTVGTSALLLEKELITPEKLATGITTFPGISRRLVPLTRDSSIVAFEGFGSSYKKARAAIESMTCHFPGRRLVVVFEPHTFSWRNRSLLHWYHDVFENADLIFICEPASQGAATHEQLEHLEIIEEVEKTGIEVHPISKDDDHLTVVGEHLEENDCVLLLTSGDLYGLPDTLPRFLEEKFSKEN